MLCVMALVMSYLSHLHFFAFKDFCKKESAEIGAHARTLTDTRTDTLAQTHTLTDTLFPRQKVTLSTTGFTLTLMHASGTTAPKRPDRPASEQAAYD